MREEEPKDLILRNNNTVLILCLLLHLKIENISAK